MRVLVAILVASLLASPARATPVRLDGATRSVELGPIVDLVEDPSAVLLVPINLGQSLTTYVDAAFGLAAIAWIAVMVRVRRLERAAFALHALILGCAVGQLIGVKGTGLPFAAIGSLALFAIHLGRRSAWPPIGALAGWWLAVAIAALPVGGFWYVRNLAHGHSPIYPIGVSVAPWLTGSTLSRFLHAQLTVDESWAISAEGDGRYDPKRLLGAGLVLYVCWVAGTAIGPSSPKRFQYSASS